MKHSIPSRREFLRQGGIMAAGVAGISLLPGKSLDPRQTGGQLLSHHPASGFTDAELLAFAQRALDTARSAGAEFADVRITRSRMVQVNVTSYSNGSTFIFPGIAAGLSIGVRAVVKGSWGFAGDTRVSADTADRVGRLAAAFARDGHKVNPKGFDFAPAPVVTDGWWETPIESDPFAVPIGDIVQRFIEGRDAVMAVKGIGGVSGTPNWGLTERLFLSTEGSKIRQKIYEAAPSVSTWAARPNDNRFFVGDATDATLGQFGYETFERYDLKTRWAEIADRVVREARNPYKPAELGQYDIVFGSEAMAAIMLPTAHSLKLDRALGDLADGAGTSFIAPPGEAMGTFKLGSPVVNITGDRSRSRAFGTVGWDEEGVKPETFPLVKNGTVVDFFTTRSYAPQLSSAYQRNNHPVRSHGCASRTGRYQPILQIPNLTLEPDPKGGTVEDLIKQVKRGYYVGACGMLPDQQMLNVQLPTSKTYEIVNGKLGTAVEEMAVQVTLPRLWNSVATLGGPAAATQEWLAVDGADQDLMGTIGCMVVPALVRNQNVITLGRDA